MATEIQIGSGGNIDKKNFYVDQNNNFYYDALYDQLPVDGQFTGNIVEIKDWNTGERLFGPALGNLDFSVSNYRPPIAGSINLSGQTSPSDLFTLKQNAAPADPEPLDIAAMNTAAEKKEKSLERINNAAEQLAEAQEARSENANTVTPEPVEETARISSKTNAIKDPLANQLATDETIREFDEQAAADAGLSQAAANAQPTFTPDTQDLDNLATDSLADLTAGPSVDTVAGDDILFNQGSISNKEEIGTTGTGGDGANTKGTDSQAGGASPLPSQFLEKIVPKSNPLAQFATYTYNISIYMINKTGLERLQQGIKSVAGLPLILQSGGAAADGVVDLYGAKRSSFFSLDYYIDDVEMEGVISGTSTQSIHNQHTIRFTITEPNGLSFLDNLHGAVKEYKTSLGYAADKINYAAQMYLMVVRFKGHQIDGIPETLGEMIGDTNGYSEKYIPFIFTGVRFRVENNKIVYHCEAAAPMSFYNLNATHSAIPFNIELNGGTVGDVLTANQVNIKQTETQRETADQTQQANTKEQKSTLYTGLVQALNQNSEKAYGKEFANVYRIEFEDGAEFEKKKIILPGSSTNKSRAPLKASKEQPSAGNTDKINKDSRIKTIQAGTSIVQAIEQIIRGSEYVTAQQQIVIDERTGEAKPADKNNPQPFQWFKVVMQATPRSDRINPLTNDYAYELVYKVKRYQVGNINSAYFPPPIFRGVHKEYPYWFTGENTEVRSFQQDFNYLYFQQVATKLPGLKLPEINATHVARNFYMPRSNENTDGTESKAGEIAASAASTLYSPGDLAQCDIEINGDPDWIAQSEIFYGTDKANNNPFEDDGSVNYNASEIYFSVEWNTPEDYNDEGLQKISRYDTTTLDPKMSLVYRANTIKTKLSAGQFTQRLSGTLMTWTDSEYVTRVDQGFKYDAQKRLDDIKKSQAEATAAEEAELDRIFAENDALWDTQMQGLTSAESMVAAQDAEFEAELLADRIADEDRAMNLGPLQSEQDFPEIFDQGDADRLETWDNVDWGDDEVEPTSTQPALTPNFATKVNTTETQTQTNPNTQTQNSITKTGGDKTVTQTPTFQEFSTPQPETTTDPADPYAQFANGIPYTRDVNDALLPEGYVYIARDASGELVQFRVLGNGDAEGIAAQDPETGEWYEI